MRIFIVIIMSLLFWPNFSNAQNDDNQNIVYPSSFNVSNSKINGKISINNAEAPLNVTGSFAIKVIIDYYSYFTEVETSIAIIDGSNVLHSVAGPKFKKSDDFISPNVVSNFKNYSINIPQDVLYDIINYSPNAQLVVRYKIYYDKSSNILPTVSSSGWLPYVFDGKEFFIHNNKYGFIHYQPKATITGPDEIGTEGAYQVNDAISFRVVPNTVSGVVDATLNHLGSGSYIVKSNQGFVGDIYLEATHSNQFKTVKKVKVTGPPLAIYGDPSICSDATYTIANASTVSLENATGIATLTDLGNDQYKVTRVGNANGTVNIKAVNASGTVVSKQLVIGVLSPVIEAPTSTIFNSTVHVTSNIINGATAKWNIIGLPEGSTTTSTTNPSITITIPPKTNNHPNSGYFIVELEQTTSCGTSTKSTKYINWFHGASGPGDDQGPEFDF